MRRLSALTYLLATLFISSCALIPREATPELRATTLRLAADYIEKIVRGDTKEAASLILWEEYMSNKGSSFTTDTFREQIRNIKDRFSPAEHPLLGLDLRRINGSEDRVTVVLFKPSKPNQDDIRINLFWASSGWLITNDTIFGPGGLIEELSK